MYALHFIMVTTKMLLCSAFYDFSILYRFSIHRWGRIEWKMFNAKINDLTITRSVCMETVCIQCTDGKKERKTLFDLNLIFLLCSFYILCECFYLALGVSVCIHWFGFYVMLCCQPIELHNISKVFWMLYVLFVDNFVRNLVWKESFFL